jgi:hypothetical protein
MQQTSTRAAGPATRETNMRDFAAVGPELNLSIELGSYKKARFHGGASESGAVPSRIGAVPVGTKRSHRP